MVLIKPRDMGKNISKSLNSKYSQKLLDHAKQSATDATSTSMLNNLLNFFKKSNSKNSGSNQRFN